MRGAHHDARPEPGAGEVLGPLIGDEPSGVQADDAVGEARRLLGITRGDEHRAALVRVSAQQPVQPGGLTWGEPPGGLIEDEGVRIAEQGDGQPQPAVHAARERPEPLVGKAAQTDDLQHVLGTADGHAGDGGEHPQVAARRAPGVTRDIAQQGADLPCGVGHPGQLPPAEQRDAASWCQLEQQPQGGGLSCSFRAQQRGDLAGARLEAEIVNGQRPTAPGRTGESDGLDHRFSR
jgi:hypothetical protein